LKIVKHPFCFLLQKNSSADRINGLKIGGDDYLAKPFNLEEFLLRIQNLIKRSSNNQNATTIDEYILGNKRIRFNLMQIIDDNGQETRLTKKRVQLSC
jgi:two-component system alkaline phosphatase synthesis response regulator PhoP